jgi:hypothetical protein
MFKRKVKNIVPDNYEFSRSYEIKVTYDEKEYRSDKPWTAECIDSDIFAMSFGNTKEEATIRIQNSIYKFEEKMKREQANPTERFTIPPIRKFNGN